MLRNKLASIVPLSETSATPTSYDFQYAIEYIKPIIWLIL